MRTTRLRADGCVARSFAAFGSLGFAERFALAAKAETHHREVH